MNRYYTILGVTERATLAELKTAYHSLAKKNHPDLFPDEQRRMQQLKMMRINEAYMRVMSELLDRDANTSAASAGSGTAAAGSATGVWPGSVGDATVRNGASPDRRRRTASSRGGEAQFFETWRGKADPGPPAETREIAGLKDPAYSYYKAGFRYFNLGATELSRKEAPKLRRHLYTTGTTDGYILRLALRALHYFERSYSYFLIVVDQYGESPWAHDARYKLKRLEKFSTIYQRICENLSRRSSTRRSSFSIVNGAEPS